MTHALHAEGTTSEGTSHQGGRSAEGTSGQFGVSDTRRAELAKMEQDAGEAQDSGTHEESSRVRHSGSEHNTTPVSAEQVGNQTEPENTDRNQY